MIRNKNKENYVFDLIKEKYNNDGFNSLVIAVEQAIREKKFYDFNIEEDKIEKRLIKDNPDLANDYGVNGCFLYELCKLYVQQARKSTKSHSLLEDKIRNDEMSDEGMSDSIFILMYNMNLEDRANQNLQKIGEKGKIPETRINQNLRKLRDRIGNKMMFHGMIIDMCDVFSREAKKEELLKKVQEKTFFTNTAQNIRMLMKPRNIEMLSGVKDSRKDYRETVQKGKYKVNNKEKVNKDIGKIMHAVSTIGKKRDNQEDAALMMVHPDNPNLKIAVVCDGAGGHARGETASYYLVKAIQEWFLEEGQDLYETETDEEQDKKIIQEMLKINEEGMHDLNGRYDDEQFAVTTMVGAIFLDGKAKILSVGDSRAYVVKNGELSQVTVDQSLAQENFEAFGKNISPYMQADDTRFDYESNYILNSFFNAQNELKLDHIHTLEQGTYDKIILCSDGVTDCMSNEEIAYFSKNVDGKRLANFLVEAANINLSIKPNYLNAIKGMYKEKIDPSKDNATAVVVEANEKGSKDIDDGFER